MEGLRLHAVEVEVATPRPQAHNKKTGSRFMICLFLLILHITVLVIAMVANMNSGMGHNQPEPNAEPNAKAGATSPSKGAGGTKRGTHVHYTHKGNLDSGSHANGFTPKLAHPRPRRISDYDVGQ